MDVTGLVALESALARLKQQGVFCIIAGLRPQPLSVLQKAGVKDEPGRLHVVATLDEAANDAQEHVAQPRKAHPAIAT
jgi:SulP family sulfate permease